VWHDSADVFNAECTQQTMKQSVSRAAAQGSVFFCAQLLVAPGCCSWDCLLFCAERQAAAPAGACCMRL
jgi:hypothetical protein